MTASSNMRFLHVASGTCTTSIIEAAGIPGVRSIWADPLYEGPVPGGLSDEELLEARRRYLTATDEEVDPVNDLRRWRQVIADHAAYDELVLWYEHDLFDQLNLIQLLSWISSRVPAEKVVSLICVASFPGHPRFKGLGELVPSELASLFETRRRVGAPEYTVAAQAWHSFREPSPEGLDRLRHSNLAAMPYLASALDRFLQEYPSTIDGLSRTERRLLHLAADGPIDVASAFPRMHDDEEAYYVTDLSLDGLVATLSSTSPALLTFSDGSPRTPSALHGTIDLTAAGQEVLDRRRDRVSCGLDRWLGGVHLRDGGPIWRWDDGEARVVKT